MIWRFRDCSAGRRPKTATRGRDIRRWRVAYNSLHVCGTDIYLDALEIEAQVTRLAVLTRDELSTIHDPGLGKCPIDVDRHVAARWREHGHVLKAQLAIIRLAFATEVHECTHPKVDPLHRLLLDGLAEGMGGDGVPTLPVGGSAGFSLAVA